MNRRLWLLLIAHVIIGSVVGVSVWACPQSSSYPSLRDTGLLTLLDVVYCQSCLLAFWAALSDAALWKRLVGLICGTMYLDVLFLPPLPTPEGVRFFFCEILALVFGILTVVVLFVRFRQLEIRRVTDQPTHEHRPSLQFSIPGLILLTLAVGLLIAAANVLRSLDLSRSEESYFVMLSVSFAVTGLASLWATLGLGWPVARNIAVLFMSPLLGLFVCYAGGASGRVYLVFIMMTLCPTLGLLGSLLVIRSCGYRLVKRDRNAVAAVSS